MEKQELQKLCSEKSVLLDVFLSNLFLNFENSFVEYFINKIRLATNKKFIDKNLIKENSFLIKKIISDCGLLDDDKLNLIKNELNLDLIVVEKNLKKSPFLEENSRVKVKSSYPCIPKKLEVKDFTIHFKNRYNSLKNHLETKSELENLISIGKILDERQKFSVIGMVFKKQITKNKNIIFEIEDNTGRMKVLISANKEDLIEICDDVPLDGVIGFKGLGNREIMFVNEIIFPDTNLDERKKAVVEEYALFTGDIHYGSKNFLEKDFLKFIDYLNGKFPNTPEVEKIKYLFIVGDLITGVGNYPDQEKDLVLVDLEAQFEGIANLLSKIRPDIKIIISPGNHDCVRLMEPQPILDEKYSWPLSDLPNVILVENPSIVNIGERDSFAGYDVLCYHGFSFPYYANNVSKLVLGKAMNDPEKIMGYLLKNRHLAPTHSSTQYFPSEKDGLLIRKAPDIFFSGHTHKSGVVYYNNILIVSSSSWEGLTPYQEKFGNKPDHCKVPMINLKTRQVKILDFETIKNKEVEDGEKD